MGKDKRGKECGKGIYQRKDGKYSARYYDRMGKRHEMYFNTVQEAKKWRIQVMQGDTCIYNPDSNMTVDEWFNFWMKNLNSDLAPNTQRNYRERYKRNIQPVVGMMKMTEVRPMHCKMIFNRMNDD